MSAVMRRRDEISCPASDCTRWILAIPTTAVDSANETSSHVRRARGGDSKSIAGWSNASRRIARAGEIPPARLPRGIYDAEDLVQDAWLAALPRLPDLPARDQRYTPVLMRFLSTALLNRSNTLLQKHLQGKPLRESPERRRCRSSSTTRRRPSPGRCARRPARRCARCSTNLPAQDRDIVVLRGIEQNRNETVAKLLKLKPNTVAVRYRRALERLRKKLRGRCSTSWSDEVGLALAFSVRGQYPRINRSPGVNEMPCTAPGSASSACR